MWIAFYYLRGNVVNTVWWKLTVLPAGKSYITAADSDLTKTVTLLLLIIKTELTQHYQALLFELF